jgi:hypothetical protein
MRTQIEFLQQYRDDLLEAAWRESVRPSRKHPRRPWRSWSRRRLIALGVAATLVVAGLTGFVALRLTGNRAGLQNAQGRPAGPKVVGSAGPDHSLNSFGAVGGTSGYGHRPHFPGLSTATTTTTTTTGPPPQAVAMPSPAPAGETGDSFATKIVKNAQLSVRVPKGGIDRAVQDSTDIAARFGGFVEGTSTYGADTGSVEMRVPVKRFEAALSALTKLGHVTARQISGTDVTARFVDLTGRLRIARERRGVLLRLLSQATTIGQTLQVQNALNGVELTIEGFQGQIRLLANQAAQSTIRVSFATPNAPTRKPRPASTIQNPSFTRGLKHAVAGFLGVLVVVLVGLGYLIPVAVLALIVWLAVRWIRGRGRRAEPNLLS